MDKNKRKALEAAGYVFFDDAADFLELTPEERQLVELRLAISRSIRTLREARQQTQAQVARTLRTSQPRFAKIEAGDSDVSLDSMFRGFFVLGGTMKELAQFWAAARRVRSEKTGNRGKLTAAHA
jgi:predicted XRE-type DNA-binding protein